MPTYKYIHTYIKLLYNNMSFVSVLEVYGNLNSLFLKDPTLDLQFIFTDY